MKERPWKNCSLSKDLEMEILNNPKFAVEFFTILQDKGNADPIYSDSKLFFKKTFLTQNMDI